MPQGPLTSAPSRTLKAVLAERDALPAKIGLAVFRQVFRQVRALHAGGATHRAVGPEAVSLDATGRATLAAAEPVRELDGADAGSDGCPPELAGAGAVRLPADIEAARQELARAGVDLDPRRIDVYQLGALLCRMLTGQPVSAYLSSPRTKSRVPPPLRPLIERALGHNPAERFADCDVLAAALEAVGREPAAAAPETPPAGSAIALPSRTPPGGAGSPTGPSPSPSGDLPFTRLGHYRVDRRIGCGGMGDVYLGYEEALQRPVAIKVLPAELMRGEDFVRRFRAEATAAAKLTHPNIVPIYSIGHDAGCHYFVMQYVEGESLDRLLARKGRLGVDEALTILEQCLAGLGAAHRAGLVHRDVKPGNVLLEADSGRALVADFGLVKVASAEGGATATGVVMGTVDYIAPEQARGREVDGRADLYALGVLAYRMLSGRLPFEAETPSAMLFQHAYETPKPLGEAAPDVPEALAALVDKLMAKDPAARYQSCAEVLADFRRWRAGEPAPAGAGMAPAGRASQIIAAPDGEPPPALPFRLEAAGRWQRLRDRLMDWLQARAPELVQRLQNTEQQVDGAVAEYQRRRDRLAGLIEEAAEAADALAAQAESHRQAAAAASAREQEECERVAADLDAQAAEQQGHLARMRAQLAQVEATLGRLRGQGELLQARLRVAAARQRMEEGPARPRRLLRLAVAAAVGLVLLVGLAAGGLFLVRALRQGPAPAPPPASGGEPAASPPQPVYIIHPLKSFSGHTDRVTSVALSPDGLRLISGSGGRDMTMRMWDVSTGAQLYSRPETSYGVGGVAFSPDSRQAVSGGGPVPLVGGEPFRLHLWDVDSGQEVRFFKGHTLPVTCASFSADGLQILSGSVDKTVRLWDTASGRQLRQFIGHTNTVDCVALSSDGRRVLSCGGEASIRLWDVATGETIRSFPGHKEHVHVCGVAFCTDGRHMASVGADATIRVWDLESGQEQKCFSVDTPLVMNAALSRDGRRALFAYGDGTIHLWDVEGGNEIACLQGHRANAWCVAFSPDGRYAVSGGMDKTVLLWDLTSKPDGGVQPATAVTKEESNAEISNSINMKLRLIQPGRFLMGAPVGEPGAIPQEGPQHPVEITRPYYMAAYPVTKGQFAAFAKDDGYMTEAEKAGEKFTWRDPHFEKYQPTDDDPVVSVSWHDAVNFCAWLSKREGRIYELPTEAEWEYACRAGTAGAYSYGDDAAALADYAWYHDNSGNHIHPAGGKKPNPWGLYDMHGDVCQWCADGYAAYESGFSRDPIGPNNDAARVFRGGSWNDGARICRCAFRNRMQASVHVNMVGFRVVLRTAGGSNPDAGHKPTLPMIEDKPKGEITNSLGMRLASIPAGTFLMGSPKDEEGRRDDEGPQHEVEITRPFFMGACPVSVGQFRAFVQDSGYQTEAEKDGKGGFGVDPATKQWEQKPEYTWRHPGFSQGDDHPVVQVSWSDATAFCAWLSKKEGKTYELPTEAEWEYACRAGTTTRFWCGSTDANLQSKVNIADASLKEKFPGATWAVRWDDGYAFTSPVGTFKPNPWGLYDMHANVWQWCADWYGLYQEGSIKDPKGEDIGNSRVLRGGSWYDEPRYCRSAIRYDSIPADRCDNRGFRVVLRAAAGGASEAPVTQSKP